jgi:hypothetical protein
LADPGGAIALIDRGACAASLKIDAAARAGAVGTLIGLIAPGDPIAFSYGGIGLRSIAGYPASYQQMIKNALATSPVDATISPDNAIPPGFSTLCGPG